MPNFTVRNIPKGIYKELRQSAEANGRSLNAEILASLKDKAEMGRRRREAARAMREIDRVREKIARTYPNQPDSVDLIRDDRDSR